ncbi:MAG TPA: hypothetical protein PLC55_06225 [Zoogloea sp.]|nr:hypothetical protein [Zoogloea sp.]
MMSSAIRRLGCAAFALLGAAPALAASVIGQTAVSTSTFVVGASPQITVTSTISDPNVNPSSVTLQRLNSDGTVTNVGVLHDDGLNGDVSFGDHVFSLRFPLSASTPTEFRFRVSAAFKGQIKRAFSETIYVYAQPSTTPAQTLSQLADELGNGNIDGALKYFSANPRNREKLASFTPKMLSALSAGLRTATLLRSDGPTRVYAVSITNGSASITAELGLTQIPSGEWYVMYW